MSLPASVDPAPARSSATRLGRTVGWGLYASSSWTWCIGMFLPIILLDRFGYAGFWAFAIPNVVGCAAFGYVFSAVSSRAFVRRHLEAVRWFGLATIAFQVFFLGWSSGLFLFTPETDAQADPALLTAIERTNAWPIAATILTWTAAALAISRFGDRVWLVFAWVTALGSGVLFSLALAQTGGFPVAPPPDTGPTVLGAVPLLVLGFLACPALDATFHRARQQSPSRHSFAVFGAAFLVMLLFAASTFDREAAGRIAAVVLPLAVIQWTLQIVFTVGAHLREQLALPPRRLGAGVLLLLAILVGGVAGLPILAGEATYLCFLGLYGVVFPMYVVAAAVAGGRGLRPPAGLIVVGASILLSPLAWFGFVENRIPLLLPLAAAVVIVGWGVGRRFRVESEG